MDDFPYTRDNRYVSEKIRKAILERDEYTCRYCGNKKGPFHIDHVYPHVKGGKTIYGNLVTACVKCNKSKKDSIGWFPKPIGYFKRHSPYITVLTLLGVVCLINSVIALRDGFETFGTVLFFAGMIVSFSSIAWNITRK